MLGTMKVIARGGKALYGAPLGILMLEAKFPRIPGDMGNAATWPFPVLYRVVGGATPERVEGPAGHGATPGQDRLIASSACRMLVAAALSAPLELTSC